MKKLLMLSVAAVNLIGKAETDTVSKVVVADANAKKENKMTEKQLEELASNISLSPLKQGPAFKVIETVASELVKEKNLSISAKKATEVIMDNIMNQKDAVAGVFRFELSESAREGLLEFSKSPAGKEWFEKVGSISHATSTVVMDAMQEAIGQLEEKYGKADKSDKDLKTEKPAEKAPAKK